MDDRVVYMLYDKQGGVAGGPLLGDPGLDLPSLTGQFRHECYARAEAAGEDHCFLSEERLMAWLVERGILTPAASINLTVDIDSCGEDRYAPSHWPMCPECGRGRGEEASGRIRRELNRWEWFRKCTECGHLWGHHDEPYHHDKPMLDDDGRCLPDGCAPYAISQAGDIEFSEVLEACRAHGWTEGQGIAEERGIDAARSLGLMVESSDYVPQVRGRLTLRRVLDALPPTRNFIVATRGHWLAVVRGESRDVADTNMRAEVVGCWEVQQEERK